MNCPPCFFVSFLRICAALIFLFAFAFFTANSAKASVIINGAIWPNPISGTEVYTDPTSGVATTVTWRDAGDLDPTAFEQYTPPHAQRETDATYDHDGNAATADIVINNALEVNDDDSTMVLTASFVLANAFSAFPNLFVNFGADSRGGVFGATVELQNMTTMRYIIPNTAVVYDTVSNDWQFNELTAVLLSTDFAETLELRFINPDPSTSAEGLELTALNLSVIPEPSNAMLLMAILAGGLLMRQRRSVKQRA